MNPLLFILIGLVLPARPVAITTASPWPPPGPARMEVSWRVVATPDEGSAEAGAIPFETTIELGPPLVDFLLTGAGCMVGKFPQPLVSSRVESSVGHRFDATSRSADGSTVSWSFLLRDNLITGEIVLTQPGTPVLRRVAEDAERRQIEALAAREVRGINGQVVNAGELKEIERGIREGRNLVIGPGRTLRFVFQTKEVRVSPRGEWPQGPTTRAFERNDVGK